MSVRAGTYLSELAVFERELADLRRGRPLDVAYQHKHAGSEWLRAGRRREAVVSYLRVLRLGHWGALVRAAALPLPLRLQPWLRRRFLSNGTWMRQAESWLAAPAAPAQVAAPGHGG
ncbi:MAG: hypothetical protein AB1505_24855 [Candidatus Latescibacterota bacterium]